MLLFPHALDFPTAPDALFGRPGPFVLEIGFGNGGFLAELAQREPGWNLLGIEIAPTSVTRAYRMMRHKRIETARLMQGDARHVVRNVVPEGSLSRVYVNFPDPWPKERHHRNRLMQVPFLQLLVTRMRDDGVFFFTSDHAEYFGFAMEQARESGVWDVEEREPPPEMLETKYARRWQARDIPIQHAALRPAAGRPHRTFPPTIERTDMHHVNLDGDLSALGAFEKQRHEFPGGQVVLLDLLRRVDDDVLFVTALVEEEAFKQEVLVEVRPSRKGVYVGLKRFGTPVVTRGVQRAIDAVAGWLESQGLERREDGE